MPPNAFPGAAILDWIGIAGAIGVLAFNYLQNRGPAVAPQPAKPS
jgi:hypothetical protein